MFSGVNLAKPFVVEKESWEGENSAWYSVDLWVSVFISVQLDGDCLNFVSVAVIKLSEKNTREGLFCLGFGLFIVCF